MTTTMIEPERAVADSAGPATRTRTRRPKAWVWFLLPGIALLATFFFIPLANIVWQSFTDPAIGLDNYRNLITDGVSVRILVRTLLTAATVAILTLLLAYPYAYAMTRASARARSIMTILVLLPFWTSLIARNFAWFILEEGNGLIDRFFQLFGVDDVVLLGTLTGVTVAMVQVMLPYMVLPLYTSMNTIDRRLLDAAVSCGAPWRTAFRTVYFPLSVPGVISGFSLVFIMSLGFYITPALLGTPQQALIPQLIEIRVQRLLDFGAGGALGVVLLLVTLLILAVVARIAKPTSTLDRLADK
ncbi:ABC transporter permease [Rhodococcus sp. NPDC057014]|uniref:ABC transporter permease n=1 Tax=Rhodococcus sp. NPDC057014 TaxID=3346000 RepID=UPI00362CA8BB